MENKSNKGLVGFLIALVVILLALVILLATGKLSFNFNNSEESSNNINEVVSEEENKKEVEEKVNANWINYLLSQDITEITINRIRSKDLGDSYDLDKTVTITKEELRQLLSKIEDNTLYSLPDGIGGPTRDILSVKYIINNEQYIFSIWNGIIFISEKDNKILEIFEGNNYKYREGNDNMEDTKPSYEIVDYSSTIYDKYFN